MPPFPGNESFALECPGITPHLASVPYFVVIGHRGAAAVAIENTLPSMQAAVRAGATAVEIDLGLTKDGKVVLWHDWDPDTAIALARQAGAEPGVKYRPWVPDVGDEMRRPIDELTLAELRRHYGYASIESSKKVEAHIPTFQEFVTWAAREPALTHVILDIKVPKDKASLTNRLMDETEAVLTAAKRKFTAVYSSPVDAAWRALGVRVPNDNVAFDVDPGTIIANDKTCKDSSSEHARKRGGGYASTVRPSSWGNEDWKALKTLLACDLKARDTPGTGVRKVFAATIDERDKLECLMDLGVDGLLTNDPKLLADILAERRPARPATAAIGSD